MSVKERWHSIDFIKGICILFVIITHYAWGDAERLKWMFPFWIDMAVPIFMIISGFVYAKSFEKRNIKTLKDAYVAKNLLGKIVRYSIPFCVAFVIEEIAYSLIYSEWHSFREVCIGFFRGGYGPGSYYYPIMIQFVFMFPIIYAIIQKYAFKGLFLCGGINFLYEVLKTSYGMNEDCYRFLLFRYVLLIAYGCWLAMENYKKHTKLSILCFCIGCVYIYICKYIGLVPPITNYWTGTSLWAALYIIPLSTVIILSRKIRSRFVETLGKASYDIFLVQMVYYSGVDFIYRIIGSRWLQLLINIIVCIFAGIIFFMIETPITNSVVKKIYRFLDNRKSIYDNNEDI